LLHNKRCVARWVIVIAAQQAMCGSVGYRDAEITRNKIALTSLVFKPSGKKNRKNGSVRDANFLFQLHDGHSLITLNQLSHFFNQGDSGNLLTALRYMCTHKTQSFRLPSQSILLKLTMKTKMIKYKFVRFRKKKLENC